MNKKTHVQNRRKNKSGYPIVEIIWNDAQSEGEDWIETVNHQLALTTTIGYQMRITAKAITVVSTINHNHMCSGITIPMGCIVKLSYV